MNTLSEKRKGEVFAIIQAIAGAFLPIVAVLSYVGLGSISSLAWSTFLAAVLLGIVILVRGTWRELKDPLLWKYGALIALFIGVLVYGFYFAALEVTSPGNVAIIMQFEVFTAFLFFNVFRREQISRTHILGAILMVLGAGMILFRDFSGINVGDALALAATICAPAGNYFQQKARAIGASDVVLFLRYLLSVPPLILLAYILDSGWSFADLRVSIVFLLINGVVILGISKIFWLEAIHRISVTKAVALGSVGPFFTLLFAWILLVQEPTVFQLSSLVPLVVGTLLLTDQVRFKRW